MWKTLTGSSIRRENLNLTMGLAAITPLLLHLQHATPALTPLPQLVKVQILFNYFSKY